MMGFKLLPTFAALALAWGLASGNARAGVVAAVGALAVYWFLNRKG